MPQHIRHRDVPLPVPRKLRPVRADPLAVVQQPPVGHDGHADGLEALPAAEHALHRVAVVGVVARAPQVDDPLPARVDAQLAVALGAAARVVLEHVAHRLVAGSHAAAYHGRFLGCCRYYARR